MHVNRRDTADQDVKDKGIKPMVCCILHTPHHICVCLLVVLLRPCSHGLLSRMSRIKALTPSFQGEYSWGNSRAILLWFNYENVILKIISVQSNCDVILKSLKITFVQSDCDVTLESNSVQSNCWHP